MAFLTRLTQILSGKNLTPQTELEAAVKQAVANAGGGGGLVVNFTLTPTGDDDPPTVASDTSVADIYAALAAGKYVVGIDGNGAGYMVRNFEPGYVILESFEYRITGESEGDPEWVASLI